MQNKQSVKHFKVSNFSVGSLPPFTTSLPNLKQPSLLDTFFFPYNKWGWGI